jgi:hypothetical protein
MKKLIMLSLVTAGMVLTAGLSIPAYAQAPAPDDTPTFYRLVPGTYVNGWPRFTLTYPKDWLEAKPAPHETFRVTSPDRSRGEALAVVTMLDPLPLDRLADRQITFFKGIASDLTLVTDKASQLRDGTPARETEIQMIQNGLPLNFCAVATKKGDLWISVGVGSRTGKISDDLKAILYSRKDLPSKEEAAKVPLDIREFLDRYRNAMVAHDLAKVAGNFSDRYLNSGVRKAESERFQKQYVDRVTSWDINVTDFVQAGDRAYLTGFVMSNLGTISINWSIIKENGEWKFYGNQRDAPGDLF